MLIGVVAGNQYLGICRILLLSYNPQIPQLGIERKTADCEQGVRKPLIRRAAADMVEEEYQGPSQVHLWYCYLKPPVLARDVYCGHGYCNVYVLIANTYGKKLIISSRRRAFHRSC